MFGRGTDPRCLPVSDISLVVYACARNKDSPPGRGQRTSSRFMKFEQLEVILPLPENRILTVSTGADADHASAAGELLLGQQDLVLRFRISHHLAAYSGAKFGIKGALAISTFSSAAYEFE